MDSGGEPFDDFIHQLPGKSIPGRHDGQDDYGQAEHCVNTSQNVSRRMIRPIMFMQFLFIILEIYY